MSHQFIRKATLLTVIVLWSATSLSQAQGFSPFKQTIQNLQSAFASFFNAFDTFLTELDDRQDVVARAHSSGAGTTFSGTDGHNRFLDSITYDPTGSLDVTDGPKFTAPVAGYYDISYQQNFRNSPNDVQIPSHWQYDVHLSINGVHNFGYVGFLSDINVTKDYASCGFADVIYLNVGDTVEAMEGFDPGAGGGQLQKYSASFSIRLRK